MKLTNREKGIAILILILSVLIFIVGGGGPIGYLILFICFPLAIYFAFLMIKKKNEKGKSSTRLIGVYIIWVVIHILLYVSAITSLMGRPSHYLSLYPIFNTPYGIWINFNPRVSYYFTDLLFYTLAPIVFYYAYKLITAKND